MSRRAKVVLGTLATRKLSESNQKKADVSGIPLLAPYHPHTINADLVVSNLKKMVSKKVWRQSHDRAFRIRNILLLFNVLVSLCLLISAYELEWDADAEIRVEKKTAVLLKTCISCLTIVQLGQTIEYYILLIKKKANFDGQNEIDAAGKWVIFSRTSFQLRFWTEILVLIPHPPPFLPHPYDKIGLLMFLRLYIGLKVLRDYSLIYKNRKRIAKLAGYEPSIEPGFNTYLSVKSYYNTHPVISFITVLLILSLTMGYCIHVLERETQPEAFDLEHSLYTALAMMLIGWPTDPNGFHSTQVYAATILAYILSTVGLSVVTLLMSYVLDVVFAPTSLQKAAVNWAKYSRVKRKSKNASATLIQLVYRYYRKKKRGKINKVKEEAYKSELKDMVRKCKTLRWKKFKREQVAASRPLMKAGALLTTQTYEILRLQDRKYIETMINESLTDVKQEILNEVAKLFKKAIKKMGDKEKKDGGDLIQLS
eukprot:TRINITY_DN5446_c0_g1_i2.p1 TRINITY_DN5446_c0_g1~~TRINITY_DN5446_c0_g1_i2.p1  ORF type:complete len:482 (-),score=62.98 TRINITY_DN5446_c0_g1_i2:76-1521(-)